MMSSSLCNLCVLCVSVVNITVGKNNHRGTENTEVTQRRSLYFGSSSFKVFSSHMRAFSTDVRSVKGSNMRGGPSTIFKEQKGTGLRAASHLCGSAIAG